LLKSVSNASNTRALFFSSTVCVISPSFGTHSRYSVGTAVCELRRCVECGSIPGAFGCLAIALVEKRVEHFDH
jgi:hypothetical protein